MARTAVVISTLPPRTQEYYDWFVTGLEILRERGELEVRYEDHWWDRLLRFHPRAMDVVRRISPHLEDFVSPIDYFCLTGRVERADKAVTFAMDVADAPFHFALGLLEAADLYFKCQCPIRFEREGFALNKHVRIPFHPDVFNLQHKIRPALLGRPLGRSTSLRRNRAVLRQWESAASPNRPIRLFASFAANKEVKPRTARSPLPAPHNYGSETTLLARWGNQIHHPDLKRVQVVEMLRSLGEGDVNARIWGTDNPAVRGDRLSPDEYAATVGRSMINVNISGFRRSLPFRFMDTFMTGGAVATDTLAIRWYKDFVPGIEVFEIGDLGYELSEEVNWPGVKQTLTDLHHKAAEMQNNFKAVLDLYRKKWAPPVFASYVIEECLKAMEQKRH